MNKKLPYPKKDTAIFTDIPESRAKPASGGRATTRRLPGWWTGAARRQSPSVLPDASDKARTRTRRCRIPLESARRKRSATGRSPARCGCCCRSSDHVPQRDVARMQKRGFFADRLRHGAVQQPRQHAPEAVLRMPVEKRRLARPDRRERAEDEHARLRVIQRRERVCQMLHHSAASASCTASGAVAHDVTKRAAVCSASTFAVNSQPKRSCAALYCASVRMGKIWFVGEFT